MDLAEIRSHWERLGRQFGEDLKATTKTSTIKELEIDALRRAICKTPLAERPDVHILEAGCGNGYNCLALAGFFSHFDILGVDYVPAMIDNAWSLQQRDPERYRRVAFEVGDVLTLARQPLPLVHYDLVFTDRCLINLNSIELQLRALDELGERVTAGGYLAVLENSQQSYRRQNKCREMVGLPPRVPDPYNLFLDEDRVLPHVQRTFELIHIDDFGSLHDLLLYVLTPLLNGGQVDYLHPIVRSGTELSLALSNVDDAAFGAYGQNRLFLFRKPV